MTFWRQIKALVTAALLVTQMWAIESAADQSEPRVVRVGVYQNAPQVFIDSTGTPRGIYIDILDEVARLEGWKLDYVQGSFAEHLEAVAAERLDMMTSIAATPERKKVFDFSHETFVSVWAQLYVTPSLRPQNILDLDGLKIAVMRDGLLGKKFQELCLNFAINCQITAVASYDDALQAVDDGKVDGAVVNSILGFSREKKYKAVRSSIVFSPVPLQVALPKGKNADLVAALDGHLALWRNNKSSIYYQIIDRWLGLKPEETFTVPSWLKWLLFVGGASIAFIFFWNRSLHQEVNRRKKTEKALRESEQRYLQILENMSSGVAIYEAVDNGQDFVFIDFNAAGERIEKISKSETVRKRLTEVFPSVSKFGLLEVLHRVWATGQPEHFPIAMYKDERISGWRENYIFKLPTGEVVAMYDDITEHKQAEEALRKSEVKFHSIVQTTSEGFWLIDVSTKNTLEVNSALCEMLGYTESEILGKTPFDFVDEENAKIFHIQTLKIADTDNRAYNITLKHKDGHDIHTHFEASTIRNDDGSPRIAFAFIKDITESVRIQNELRLAKDEADQANQAKSAFLASMSHELRTPLNSIIGFAEMMHYEIKGPLSEHYKEYTSLITRSGRLLLETINSVLDIAKIEAGKFELIK
ncbi:PAS domain S-box protein, partial [Magnetovibrio blakemorei]|uniref:PAS domain S-box protein n=1 Tax=Magnetovibrio blakemorei TaxID=28181 RepID=UPI0011130194